MGIKIGHNLVLDYLEYKLCEINKKIISKTTA